MVVGALAAAWLCASRGAALVATIAAMIWLFWRDDTLHLATPDGLLALVLLAATAGHVLRHSSLAGRLAVLAAVLSSYSALAAEVQLDFPYQLDNRVLPDTSGSRTASLRCPPAVSS